MKKEIKKQAIELRKRGFSHGEIHKKLGVSKSTSSLWSQGLRVPIKSKNVLAQKAAAGRKKGRDVRQANITSKYESIRQSVFKDLNGFKLNKTTAKLLCAMLYWGEGSKASGRVVFTNSDPNMVKTFLVLFRYAFKPIEKKFTAVLHLHPYHNESVQKRFWSRICALPQNKISIFHKKSYGNLIRPNYPGCIAINYGDMEKLKELMYYYERATFLIGGFV